jgi:SAM-dependent methyltransferase
MALVRLLAGLPPPPDPVGLYPEWARLQGGLRAAMDGNDAEALEEAFLALYAHLHSHAAPYTREEREAVDAAGGYWAHAGGISPVLKAPDFLAPGCVSADLGAGTGLQLLLLQKLAPHRKSVQVEVSSRLVEAGRALQRWLGVPEDRVEWRRGDLTRLPFPNCDFLYLYRPVRPDGAGRVFYERLAERLVAGGHPVVVFSVADCLGQFLGPTFERFYFDGHLACFRGP